MFSLVGAAGETSAADSVGLLKKIAFRKEFGVGVDAGVAAVIAVRPEPLEFPLTGFTAATGSASGLCNRTVVFTRYSSRIRGRGTPSFELG